MIRIQIHTLRLHGLHVIHFRNGKVVQGRTWSCLLVLLLPGVLSFQYQLVVRICHSYSQKTLKDFQTITIQGQITYRIANPQQLADLLDFHSR